MTLQCMQDENDVRHIPCKFLPLQNQESAIPYLHDTSTHILKICPKFHHARTAAHNPVSSGWFMLLQKHFSSESMIRLESLWTNTSISDKTSTQTSRYRSQASSRPDKQSTDSQKGPKPGRTLTNEPVPLGRRWQRDIIGILLAKKKIAIGPEVTIPSDSRSWALLEIHNGKLQFYSSLLRLSGSLQDCADSGWTVRIRP